MTTTGTNPHDSAAPDVAPYTVAPDGYRLPAGLQLGPVRLQVADLERSIDYYERVLGLRATERQPKQSDTGGARRRGPARRARGAAGRHARSAARPARPLPLRAAPPRPGSLGRFVAHLAALGEYAGIGRSPGERGAVPHRPRRTRHRGVRRPAQVQLADAGPLARDGDRPAGSRGPRPSRAGTCCGPEHRRAPGWAMCISTSATWSARAPSTTRRSGLDRIVLELPGRALHVGGRVSPSSRHEHLGRGRPSGHGGRRPPARMDGPASPPNRTSTPRRGR